MFVPLLSFLNISHYRYTVRRGPAIISTCRKKAANRGIHTLSSRPYRFYMSEPKYPNSVLFQQLERFFSPAADWESCEMPMSTPEFFEKIHEVLPGYFEDSERIREILEAAHYQYAFNENNKKYYWLVNPPILNPSY
ncbi:hypothetical protein SAMN05421827_109128 [Pedobacter terrae]|uniref:Uncharacterized protein n=2 Tax=Pedobacter terrae TaxID=405671 RepID=A0A1G7W7J4_9SPHI|nr:hypothetical protein SAMN05421827_109128 [Pedobacter terrae]